MIEFSNLKKMIKCWDRKFVASCLENVRLKNLILARYLQYVLIEIIMLLVAGIAKVRKIGSNESEYNIVHVVQMLNVTGIFTIFPISARILHCVIISFLRPVL